MRFALPALLGAAMFVSLAPAAQAQYVPYRYTTRYRVRPYPVVTPFGYGYAPAVNAYRSYYTPYGYAGYSTYNAYPGAYGYNSNYNYGNFSRPYAAGPFISLYRNPYNGMPYYGPGYLNSPSGYSFYRYGY